jgi:hypothetical protein
MENKEVRILKNFPLYVWGPWICLTMIPISFFSIVYFLNELLDQNLFFELYAYQKLAFAAFFCIFFTWIYLFRFKPLSFVKVTLFKDGFKIHWIRRQRFYAYDDVKSIERIDGNTKIVFNDRFVFMFNHKLERAEYLIECLAKVNPKVFRKKDVRDYRDPLFHGSMKFARSSIFLKKSHPYYIGYVVASLVLFFWMYYKQRDMFVTQGIEYVVDYFFRTSLMIGLVLTISMEGYVLYSQYQHMQRLKRNVLDKRRDAQWESSIIDKMNWVSVFVVGFAFFSFYYYDLNAYNVQISKNAQSKISVVVFDKRYKCFNCDYPIEKGLTIVDPDGRIGIVKGVAGDLIGQDIVNQIRKPASTTTEVVGRDQIAFEIDGVIHYIPKEFVQGRLIFKK